MPYPKNGKYNYTYQIVLVAYRSYWEEFREAIEEEFNLNEKTWKQEPWRVDIEIRTEAMFESNELLELNIYCDSSLICYFIKNQVDGCDINIYIDADEDTTDSDEDDEETLRREKEEKEQRKREQQKQVARKKQREREQLTREVEENDRKQIIRNREHRAEIEREFRNDIKYEFIDFCLGACWKRTDHRYGSLFIDSWKGAGRYGAEKYCQECGHKDHQIKWSETFNTEQ